PTIARKPKELKGSPYRKEWPAHSTRTAMGSPNYWNVDGKVWANNQETRESYRLDVKTGQWENGGISKDPRGKQVRGYGMPVDKQNNLYMLEFSGPSIGKPHAKTRLVPLSLTPTPR